VISTQHSEKVRTRTFADAITSTSSSRLFPLHAGRENKYRINPTGRFVIGGPWGCGLTGRKIIVDTYGGYSRHAAARSPARIPPKWIARLLHGALHR